MAHRQQDHPSHAMPELDPEPGSSAWKLGSCAGLPLFLLVMAMVIGYTLGGQTGLFTGLVGVPLVLLLLYGFSRLWRR